jgi:hypothetical protein
MNGGASEEPQWREILTTSDPSPASGRVVERRQ